MNDVNILINVFDGQRSAWERLILQEKIISAQINLRRKKDELLTVPKRILDTNNVQRVDVGAFKDRSDDVCISLCAQLYKLMPKSRLKHTIQPGGRTDFNLHLEQLNYLIS